MSESRKKRLRQHEPPSWLRPISPIEAVVSWHKVLSSAAHTIERYFENPHLARKNTESVKLLEWLDGFSASDQQEVLGRMKDVLPWIDLLHTNAQALFSQTSTYTTCTTFLHSESITIRALTDNKNVALGVGSTPTAVAKIHTYHERLPVKGKHFEIPATGLQVQVKDLSPEHIVHLDEIRAAAHEMSKGVSLSDVQKSKLAKLRRTIDNYPISQLILTVNRTTWDPNADNPKVIGGKGKVHDDPLFSISFKRVPNDQFDRGDADEIVVELKNSKAKKDENPNKTITIPLRGLVENVGESVNLDEFESFLTRIYNDIATYSTSGVVVSRKKNVAPTSQVSGK